VPTAGTNRVSFRPRLPGVYQAGVRYWALDPAGSGQPLPQILQDAFAAAFGGIEHD
jgi:hypothetical protein